MKRHLQEQVDTYGKQALVNLVNQKGYEKPVKEAYERYVAEVRWLYFGFSELANILFLQVNLPEVRYEYFDFHTECRNMRWDRISILIEKLKDDLERQGHVSS
jgi:hypothetical protein